MSCCNVLSKPDQIDVPFEVKSIEEQRLSDGSTAGGLSGTFVIADEAVADLIERPRLSTAVRWGFGWTAGAFSRCGA